MDPIDAMEQFLARIAAYDEQPDVAVAAVELRVGRLQGSFQLSERAARAFGEALARYVDPDDCGRCDGCGGHLDRNLRCSGCGQVSGVFGATIAQHAAEVASRTDYA